MSVEANRALVVKSLRPGWSERFVVPPWATQPARCRACGLDPFTQAKVRLGELVIRKSDDRERVVFWTIAKICEKCAPNRRAVAKLTVEVFAPMLPPGPIPRAAADLVKVN